ncbi:MAG: DUF357 domain-containing protein [Candidatus Hadarchaeales archaeon]
MRDPKEELEAEIERWSKRLEEALEKTRPLDKRGEKLLENIRAYQQDSSHFRSHSPVKSFECLVWAWALLEMGKEFGCLSGP